MPELEQKTFQKRQVAHKVRISDILEADFAKDELSAGYIKLNDENVSRVNVIATVVDKSGQASNYASAIIDDGTGKILLRVFENADIFSKVDVGDFALIVGKIREFSNERYILPEILKKIDNPGWVNVRKLELEKNRVAGGNSKILEVKNEGLIQDADSGIGGEVCSLIKKLDNGDGVSVEDVVNNSKSSEAEAVINRLLESGDIFEIRPGRLKVLE